MIAPNSRRGFLRGLTMLPLVGGGVTLIGAPSAVAEPVTRELLFAYSSWLRVERNRVHDELWPEEDAALRAASALPFQLDPDTAFYVPPLAPSALGSEPASSRAALVLSTVGIDWRRP